MVASAARFVYVRRQNASGVTVTSSPQRRSYEIVIGPQLLPQPEDFRRADAKPITVYPATYVPGAQEGLLIVPLSRYTSFRTSYDRNPERLHVDLLGAKLGASEQALDAAVNDSLVSAIRMSQKKNLQVRVVVELKPSAGTRVMYAPDPPRLEIIVARRSDHSD